MVADARAALAETDAWVRGRRAAIDAAERTLAERAASLAGSA
jgi:hypothetical protein